jgi:hypothetical protein
MSRIFLATTLSLNLLYLENRFYPNSSSGLAFSVDGRGIKTPYKKERQGIFFPCPGN